MKWIVILMIVLFPVLASAQDWYLVCDPLDSSLQIQGFKGTFNGTPFDTNTYVLHSGKAIIYNFGSMLPSGSLDFKNLRAYNVRGEGGGVDFFYPAAPPSLTNVGLTQ